MEVPFRPDDAYINKLKKRLKRLEEKFKEAPCNDCAKKYIDAANIIKQKLNEYVQH